MVFRRCFLDLSRDTCALQCVGGFLLAHVALLPEVVHHAVLHHPDALSPSELRLPSSECISFNDSSRSNGLSSTGAIGVMTVVGLLPRLRISLRLFSALAPSAPIPTLAPCQKSRLVASLPNATAPAGSVIGLDVSAAAAIPVAATWRHA